MKYKAVIFDLDGTLIDSLADLASSMNRVLKYLKFPIHPVENYKRYVGDGLENLVIRALPDEYKNNDAIIKQGIDLMRVDYGNNWNINTKPYDGILSLLDKLNENGIKAAVLSNKPDNFTQVMIKEYFKKNIFDAVLGACNSFPVKPDPSGAIYIVGKLNIAPSNFIYLGDTDTDMKTAKNAGMFPVGVSWGFRTREELIASGAKIIIDKPADLLNVLGILK